MKTYIFTYTLRGSGDTEEEAREDALDWFFQDPGVPDETEEELDGPDFILERVKNG